MRLASWAMAAVLTMILSAPALGEAPLAEKIPAGALAYVGWAGQTPAFRGSTLGEFLDGQKASDLLATAKSALKNEIPPRDHPTIDRLWSALDIAWRRPGAMVLLDVSKDEKNPLDLLAVIDLGDQREAFAGHLDAVLQAGVERKHWTLEPASAGALNYQQIRMDDRNAPAVAVGYAGSVFFLAVGQGVVEQFAALSPEKSLKAAPPFQAARKDVATDKELLACYLDVAALTKKAKAMMPAPESAPDAPASQPAENSVDSAMNVLGLAKMTTIAGSISAVDKNLLTQIRLLSPAPHKGLLTLLAGEPLGDDALAHVPADAHLAAAWRLSPEAFYNELLEAAKAFHIRDEFDRDERRMQADLGLSVRQDILPAFGDTWTLATAPSWGGVFTGSILTVLVKDPAKAALVTAKVEDYVSRRLAPPAPAADPPATEGDMPAPVRRPRRSWSIEQRQVAGATVKFVVRHGEAVPVAPAWAIHQGRLYVALWPQVIESAILRQLPTGPSQAPELPATPAYAAMKRRVGKNASILAYLNGAAIARDVYNLLLIGWTAGAGEASRQVPNVRQDWLPALATLEKYLQPEMAALASDAEGITFRSQSALGGLSAAGAVIPAAATVWWWEVKPVPAPARAPIMEEGPVLGPPAE